MKRALQIFILSCVFILKTQAQLGFCTGNSGDPIFTETFGTGTINTALPAGTTTYTFAAIDPHDGFYTVSSNTGYFDWHNTTDHTVADTNGKCLIVNADFTTGEFYRTNIIGLCENTSYEFSAWLLNLLAPSGCGGSGIPINVEFQIWDVTDTNLLAFGDTGNISGTTTPNWEQYGLVFQTLPSQSEVILKMINNSVGGCGNDLAIDDLVFKTCGDFILVNDTTSNNNITICSGQTPYALDLITTPDFTVFSSHFYQWQESSDGIIWTDIVGATNQNISITGITTSMYYRAKVAEFATNLTNLDCITFSDIFQITVNQAPPPPSIDCWETTTLNNATCTWEVTGTQPSAPTGLECWETTTFNNTTCAWEITGTQPPEPTGLECWETTTFNNTTCVWDIQGEEPIDSIDEYVVLCESQTTILNANSGIVGPTYLWSTGETTEEIIISSPGTYTVEITDSTCFTTIKTIYVTLYETPQIASVFSDGTSIIVEMTNTGDFEYSLDGTQYQTSNTFINVEGGFYTVYVKERNGCGIISTNHLHFIIPKYFTPNNDGIHDTFNLKGIENYNTSEVYILNRYGKLLKSSYNQPFAWDGTFNNQLLPNSDYWYIIKIDNQVFKGHFTLKR